MKKLIILAALISSAGAQVPATVVNGSMGLSYPNDTTTGTTLGYLVKRTATGAAINASSTDTFGIMGCATTPGQAGTSGSVTISFDGIGQCVFDGTPTAGDWFENSPTVAGRAHDIGTDPAAATRECLGYVATPATALGGGLYNVVWSAGCGGRGGAVQGVTSVGLTAGQPSIFTVTNSPITSTGNITLALANQTAARALLSPVSGSPGTPSFRAIQLSDLPAINYQSVSVGGSVASPATSQLAFSSRFNLAAVAPATTVDLAQTSVTAGSYTCMNGTVDAYGRLTAANSNPACTAAGTVTSVSVATANGVSGTVTNPTTTPAITLALGAITPSSVASTGAITQGGTPVCLQNGTNCQGLTGISLSNLTFGAGAGASPTAVVSGFVQTHAVAITTGSSPASGTIYTITFPSALAHGPACVFSAATPTAAALTGSQAVFNSGISTTSYSLTSGSTPLAASTSYEWFVTCP